MNRRRIKRILAILLSVAICVSNCYVQLDASEKVNYSIKAESDTKLLSLSDEDMEESLEVEASTGSVFEEDITEDATEGTQDIVVPEDTTEAPPEENPEEPSEDMDTSDETTGTSEEATGETTGEILEESSEDMPDAYDDTDSGMEEIMEPSSDDEAEAVGVEEPLNGMLAEAGDTFASLEELKAFYTANSTNTVITNALDFPDENTIVANANGLILLSCVEGETFAGYTIKLKGISGGVSDLTRQITGFEGYTFCGLGRTDNGFAGTITINEAIDDAVVSFILDTPFFNDLNVELAKLDKINKIIITTATDGGVAFAKRVYGAGQDWSSLELVIEANKYTDNEDVTYTYPGACIGVVRQNARFALKKVTYRLKDENTDKAADVKSGSDNAGLLCNTLGAYATFAVGELQVLGKVNVTSGSGAAGGLVGLAYENATLNVGSEGAVLQLDNKWTITGYQAGAVLGYGIDNVLNVYANVDSASVIVNPTLEPSLNNASGAAGGLIGLYKLTEAATMEAAPDVYRSYSNTMTVKNVVLDAKKAGSYCGGLYGILWLDGDFSIENSDVITVSSELGIVKNGSSYDTNASTSYGGLVGQLYSSSSNTELAEFSIGGGSDKSITVDSKVNSDIAFYGGLIGVIGHPSNKGIDGDESHAAYVSLNGAIATNCTGSNKIVAATHYFGGAVGCMYYDSVLDITEGATFTPQAEKVKYGGGIVGVAARKSTLRLAGTTDISGVTYVAHAAGQTPGTQANYRYTNGQIVGAQNAAVIYATKTWVLTRAADPGEIDDIGNYGSVIRLGANIGQGSANLGGKGGLSEDLIWQDAGTHKTSFAQAAELNAGTVVLSNADDFALLAIEEQTWGDFNIYPAFGMGHILSGNTIKTIELSADIDLSNTGVGGLQRDFYNESNTYTGIFDGGGHKLTLDIGQLYANSGSSEPGNGQIHGHPQVGLFSQADAIIKNVEILGNINIRERKVTGTEASYMAVGGCVALSTAGQSVFENVTSSVTIDCGGAGTASYIGGFVGWKNKPGHIVINGCTGNATITDSTTNGAHCIGGVIGQYFGGNVTVEASSISGAITSSVSFTDARYGGLIAVVEGATAKIHLNSLTVNGQKIANGASVSSGGLLGYEWNECEVYFGDGGLNQVIVQGDIPEKGASTVNISGAASLGALVYRATGYWQVNSLSVRSANIQNGNGDLGLLVCHGRSTENGTKLLYVEETSYDAYHIASDNVSVSSTGRYFDEWVVYTAQSAATITDNGNSVISIATKSTDGVRVGFDKTADLSTGYQNKTTNNGAAWTANPNARYYYDLDEIRGKAAAAVDGYVDTPWEMVLWSVWRYCEKASNAKGTLVDSNIKSYFETDDISKIELNGKWAVIDLTGYSYYPVNIDASNVTIKNCTFVFANDIIDAAEEKTGEGLDTLNRKTSGTTDEHTQHYLMHSGIILNYKNTSTSVSTATLTLSDVTLQGVIGKGPNATGSGAIVCGTVSGSNVGGSHTAVVKIRGAVLGGVSVNSGTGESDYAPLLINTVGSYGGIDAQQIKASGYEDGVKAATSLIGNVGGESATNISLAFSNEIDLNGRTNESIFTHASLLESFRYSSACSGYYHFNEGEACTYGREINGSVEYAGLQLLYFDTRNPVTDGDVTDFNNDKYLPYVCKTKVTDESRADSFHELEINIVKPSLDKGCGTYDDPYIIEQAAQLEQVAGYINGNTTDGWVINVVKDRTKIISESDSNHKEYTFGSSVWDSGNGTLDEQYVRDYLRNAYYKITDDLELSNFVGLGNTSNPFRGVIEGGDHTVTVDASKLASGFINVSYGSVMQNLSITYKGSKTLQKIQAALNSNTVADQSYFGGIIGDVKGGDNLVNNVSVSYDSGFTITVQNHLQCVGGFFGIVEGGGVLLSNMAPAQGLSNDNISTTLNDDNKAYISPLVGRILDGFVLNESDGPGTFESTAGADKNYTIGNILVGANPTELDITYSDSVLSVAIDKREELLVLTAIINSGFCGAGYSLAYKSVSASAAWNSNSGKVRNADYSKVGETDEADFKTKYFDPARKDDTQAPSAANTSYLVTRYAGGNGNFWDLCSSSASNSIPQKYLNISILNNLDMSVYKNGYRAIGGRYNCTASCSTVKSNSSTSGQTSGKMQSNTPVFAPKSGSDSTAIDGNNTMLTVSNSFKGYSDDNYIANAAGGLVNILRRKQNEGIAIKNLTVSGSVELHDFADNPTSTATTNGSDRNYAASVGGMIGRYFTEETVAGKDNRLTLENLKVSDMSIYSDAAAGGIIGQTGTKKFYVFGPASYQYASGVHYIDCSYENLTATSCHSTGGIVGAVCDNADTYNYSAGNEDKITNIFTANKTTEVGKNSTLNVYSSSVGANGLGGLIGNVGSNVEINKDGSNPIILDTITFQDINKYKTAVSRTGGAIGFIHNGVTTAYNITISNCKMGNQKEDNLGGIVGCWYSNKAGGVMENIVIDSCVMDAELSVGGVIGYIRNAKLIRNITVKNTNITQRKNDGSRGVALVVGQIAAGGIYGENILLKGNRIICNSTAKKGRIIGNTVDCSIQLMGVSLQYGNDKEGNPIDVSKQPAQDIGSFAYSTYSSKSSKIMIVYDAFLTDKETGDLLADWPYKELPGIGDNDRMTGDTATPYVITGSDSVTGILHKEGTSFTYIGSGKTYQNVDTTKVDTLNPSIVSTYNANQDTKVENDFEVLQIDGSAACVKQYLNAATNGAFDTAVANNAGMTVDIKRYSWDSDSKKFVEAPSGTKQTLTYKDGNFYATAQYDNQNNTFTLVSVTFKTTSNNFKRTYHIPVVVRRMLQVDFMATMASGNVFNPSEMEEYRTHALASVGGEVTGYFTFKYNSNLSGTDANYDWKSYMEGGANLLGYYKKTLNIGATSFSAGTKITLIDCQQSDRRYFTEVTAGGVGQLQLYSGEDLVYKHSDGTTFEPVSIAKLLDISATKIRDESYSGVKWVSLGTVKTGEATVVDNKGVYYRLYDDGMDSSIGVTDCYELTINNQSPEENYFVVISIPKAANHMVTLMKSGGETRGKFEWSVDTSAPPTEIHQLHRYKVQDRYVTVNTNVSSEISFNFLENYKQTLKDILPKESISVLKADANVKMHFDVQNEIEFDAAHYEDTDPLYQELRVSLQKTVDGNSTDVYFPSDAKATVDLYAYYLDGDSKVYFTVDSNGKLVPATSGSGNLPPVAVSYDWVAGNDGTMILPFAVPVDGKYQYIDLAPLRVAAKNKGKFYIEAKTREDGITIGISSILNNAILPIRETSESLNQTTMQFTSLLSFRENGLSGSTLRAHAPGSKGYYLNEKSEAILKLDYTNIDQLGINLSDEHSGEINTVLSLDLSGIEGFNSNLERFEALRNADTFVFTFTLKQKGNDGLTDVEYRDVAIGGFMTGAGITGGASLDSYTLVVHKREDGTFPYYNEATGIFSVPITFFVDTTQVARYANYRIFAHVDVRNGEETQSLAIKTDKAFITYTIAKINVNGVWPDH